MIPQYSRPTVRLMLAGTSGNQSLGPYGDALGGTFTTIAPGFNPGFNFPGGGTSTPWWVHLLGPGLDILNRFLPGGGGHPGVGLMPTLPGIGNPSLATISPHIVAAGGAIIGTVIRITRAGWAKIPAWVKAAALALGLTTMFDDNGDEKPKRRRRGITAAQLTGFHRINSLLCKVGMTARRAPRRKCK